MLTRRSTLAVLAAAAAMPARAATAVTLPRDLFRRMSVIDAKTRLDDADPHAPADPPISNALAAATAASGLTLISETIGGSSTLEALVARAKRVDAAIATRPDQYLRVNTAADLRAAKDSGRMGIAYDIQGTAELGDDPALVAWLKGAGVRTVQLTYNLHSAAGDGCMVANDAGITHFGRAVVAEVNRLGLLIDVSHVGHRTAAGVVAASAAPPALTHGGCYDVTPHPRNMPDAVLKTLADKGGVFGIYLMPYLRRQGQADKADVLRHIEHAIRVCGEDHVGIGSDGVIPPLDLTPAYREYWRTEVYEPRVRTGVVAPNEGADIFNYVPEYNTAERYYMIGDDLVRRGHSVARVEKILGGNFARLFAQVWG